MANKWEEDERKRLKKRLHESQEARDELLDEKEREALKAST